MAQESTPSVAIAGTTLRILQWSHYVPAYDVWFDAFAQAWGEANDVEVTVDHVRWDTIPGTIAAELEAGSGHDIVEFVAPLAQFESSMLDMTDLVNEATVRFGEQVPMCAANSFNPTTGVHYGFCHGYTPSPGDYRVSLWEAAGLPDGPATWQDLLEGGARIRSEHALPVGIGMSNEVDSRIAALSLIWAFGGAIQDEQEQVVINSPETVAAVEYMAELYREAMPVEVFDWTAATNNEVLVAGEASYILSSISAYRTAQETAPEVARDIAFTRPLAGPGGADRAVATEQATYVSQIPAYSPNADTAREFLLYQVANYAEACLESKLYNFPAWPSVAPDLFVEGGWLDDDPLGSEPPDKLALLKMANDWTPNLGWPGPTNAAVCEIFTLPILPEMMARAATGQMTAVESVAQAEREISEIFARWRGEGLVSG